MSALSIAELIERRHEAQQCDIGFAKSDASTLRFLRCPRYGRVGEGSEPDYTITVMIVSLTLASPPAP